MNKGINKGTGPGTPTSLYRVGDLVYVKSTASKPGPEWVSAGAVSTVSANSSLAKKIGTQQKVLKGEITGAITNGLVNQIVYANNLFVATGGGANGNLGAISYSTDGVTWATANSGKNTVFFYTIAYGAGKYVAGGSATLTPGIVVYSTDAITWLAGTYNAGNFGPQGIAYSGSLFASAASNGGVRTSTDGITWNTQTSALGTTNMSGTAYGNGIFVMVGWGGALQTSSNGTAWTSRSSVIGGTHSFASFANGFHFIGNYSGGLATSTDGITWIARDSKLTSVYDCTYSSDYGLYIAIGASGSVGAVSTSTDAVTWNIQPSGIISTVSSSGTYGGIAAGAGTVVASDGISLSKLSIRSEVFRVDPVTTVTGYTPYIKAY